MKEQKKREEEEKKQKEIAAIKEAQERAKVRDPIIKFETLGNTNRLFCYYILCSHIYHEYSWERWELMSPLIIWALKSANDWLKRWAARNLPWAASLSYIFIIYAINHAIIVVLWIMRLTTHISRIIFWTHKFEANSPQSQSQDSKYLEERRKEEEKKNAMKNRANFFAQKEEENSQAKSGGKTPEISSSIADKKAAFQN